jgi:hypothetical protein
MSLSKEQIAIKEEIISELLTIENVSVHPDSAVHAADAISMMQPGDYATVCHLHCRLQDSRKAITLGTGQNSVNGLDTSLICGCCSVDCLEVISRGFNSNHVFGCAIPNVLIFNLNGGDCTTLSDEFQYCPKVTAVSGMVLAGIMNTFDDGLDRLNVCRCFFRLDGSSSGGNEMFMPYLNPTVPICKASQYHIHLARKWCKFWEIEEQRRKMTEAIDAIAKHQEECYQLYESIHGTILLRPLKNCLECALDEKRLVFISMSLEGVQNAIEDTWYDVDKLLEFLKPRRWIYLYPILSYPDSIMPQWIKIFVNNNIDELTKYATIETALSLLGTRSVQKQCEALNCTPKELMEKVRQGKNPDTSVVSAKRQLMQDKRWETQYTALVEYHKKNGHCRVKSSEDKQLNNWVRGQRQSYNGTRFNGTSKNVMDDRITKLKKLGFDWVIGQGQNQQNS